MYKGLIAQRVADTFVRPKRAIWSVTLSGLSGEGRTLSGTADHPFYLPAFDAYLPMEELQEGYQVLDQSGALLEVQSVVDTGAVADTYDFQVAGQHNYFAGGVLVHNSGGTAARGVLRGCFVAGTVVETAVGPAPIEQIREGDLVLSRYLVKGKTFGHRLSRHNGLHSYPLWSP